MPKHTLFKLGQGWVDNSWQTLDDDVQAQPGQQLIVSLSRWQEQKTELLASGASIALSLPNDVDVEALQDELLSSPLIVLNFPSFADGRAYSQARLLRERLKYQGEIRARGDVARDQLLYMSRCGFDSFEFSETYDDSALSAALSEFSVAYQSTASGPISKRPN